MLMQRILGSYTNATYIRELANAMYIRELC